MNNTKKFLLYGITVVVLILVAYYEYSIKQWEAANPTKSLVREDTYLLWALVLTLVSVSLFQIFKKKE